MNKFIRLDRNHFALLVDQPLKSDQVEHAETYFQRWWTGKKLIILTAGEFIDLTGKSEIVTPSPIGEFEIREGDRGRTVQVSQKDSDTAQESK